MMRITLEFHWMPVIKPEAAWEIAGDLEESWGAMGRTYRDVVGEGTGLISGDRWYVDVEHAEINSEIQKVRY